MHELAFVFAGFSVGLVVGLTGVGGGSLMTPLLIFAFGIKAHLAIGTDLLFAAFTKLGGSVALARARVIDWPIVLSMASGSIPASLLTLYVLHRLGPANPMVQQAMTTTLGAALLLGLFYGRGFLRHRRLDRSTFMQLYAQNPMELEANRLMFEDKPLPRHWSWRA